MKFSKEPVLYIAAAVAVLQAVLAYMTNGADFNTLVNAAVIAVGAIFARKAVVPNSKVPGEATDHDGMGDGEEAPEWEEMEEEGNL